MQVSRSVAGTKRDAEKVLNTLISKHETASVGGSTTATFGALLAAWLEQVEPDLAYQTVQGYKRLIRNHIEPALGSIKLRKLDVADPRLVLSRACEEGARARVGSAGARSDSIGTHAGCAVGLVPIGVAEKASPPRLRKATIKSPAPVDVARSSVERPR